VSESAARRSIASELEQFEEEYSQAIGAEFSRGIFENNRAIPNRYTLQAATVLPSPVQLVAAVLLR
jgi:hypothetical protein